MTLLFEKRMSAFFITGNRFPFHFGILQIVLFMLMLSAYFSKEVSEMHILEEKLATCYARERATAIRGEGFPFTMDMSKLLWANLKFREQFLAEVPDSEHAATPTHGSTTVYQVGDWVFSLLRFEGRSPIWTKEV